MLWEGCRRSNVKMGMKPISFAIICILSVMIYSALYHKIWNQNFSSIANDMYGFWRPPANHTDKAETDTSDPFMEFCNKSASGNRSIKTASKSKCGYVFRSGIGGLGNQMFQYASFYGMVKSQSMDKNGTKIAFTYDMQILEESFDNLSMYRNDIKASCMNGRIDVTIGERGCCVYDPIGQLPCDGKNYGLHQADAYQQNFKYFANVKEEIRREFNFKESIKEKSDQLLKNIFLNNSLDRQNCMTVAVHLRRGDFVLKAHYHSPASIDYLKRAIKYFENIFANKVLVTPKLQHLVFVIFGDDPNWNAQAIKQVEISNPNTTHTIVISGNHRAVDMCAMSKCDHIIISTGTFGSWGAFFNPGIVTYQKEYAGPPIRKMTDDDFWMPDWIPL